MKVDIHSVGTANGHASSRVAGHHEIFNNSGPKSQASSHKVIRANGTVSRAAPAKGKPGTSKASQKRDPAEVQRERQLADEQNVRSNNLCVKHCTDAQHCTRQTQSAHPALVSVQSKLHQQSGVICRCAWRSVRSGIIWQTGCGPWQALHRAANPSHLSIWKSS